MRSGSTRSARISSTTPATMPACSTRRCALADWDELATRSSPTPRQRREGRRRPRDVRGEERPRAVRQRAHRGRRRRHRRGHHRRCLSSARALRPRWRKSAPTRSASIIPDVRVIARPDRPYRQRHGRLCLARDGDVRRGDAARGGEAARQGARCRRRTDAGARDRTRYRRRRDRAQRRRGPRCRSANSRAPLPDGLAAEDTFESTHMVYPYGVHIAAVRVDAETGGVTIERYAVAYDVGRAVNPMLVEGQIAGGLAQGIGGALLEEFLYDDAGEPLSVTFADYLMPTAREVPAAENSRHRGRAEPAQPARPQGRRRRRRQSGRRGDCLGDRRRHRGSRRGAAIAGDAAAVAGVAGRAVITAVAIGRHKRQRRLFAQAALPNTTRRDVAFPSKCVQRLCRNRRMKGSNLPLDPDVRGRATPPRKVGVSHN